MTTEERATARAIADTLSIGIGDNAPITKMVVDQGGVAGLTLWELKWPRKKSAYEFRNDATTLNIDAIEGQILAYNDNNPSADPDSLDVSVKETAAKSRAAETATEKGFALDVTSGKLMIVNPNYRWTASFVEMPSTESRLSWVFSFQKQTDIGTGIGEIWIDASNGRLLGGEESK